MSLKKNEKIQQIITRTEERPKCFDSGKIGHLKKDCCQQERFKDSQSGQQNTSSSTFLVECVT